MAEIFDASGSMDSSGSAASSLAAALESLASPLKDIAKNTEKTADNTKDIKNNDDQFAAFFKDTKPLMDTRAPSKDMRPNADLDAVFGNVGKSIEEVFKRAGEKSLTEKDRTGLSNRKPGLMDMGALGKASANTSPMNMAALGEHAASRRATVTGATPKAATQVFAPKMMAEVTSAVAGPLSFLGRTAATVGPALAAVGSVAAPLAVAFTAVAGAGVAAAAGLGAIVVTARHFTQAFDPSMVLVFDAAMRDLNAVVGSMLVPIVGEATRVVKAFANQLYASTSTIMPAIRTIAKSVGDVFISFMPIVGQVTKLFADMLVVVADMTRTVADFVVPQVRAFGVVLAGVGSVLKSIISGLFPVLGGSFKNALVTAAQVVGKMGVAIAAVTFKLFGMFGALEAMQKSLSAEAMQGRDAGGLAAAQNARLMNVSGLGQEVLQRAFTTSGRTELSEEDEANKKYQDDLRQLVSNIADFDLRELPRLIGEAVAEALTRRASTNSDGSSRAKDALIGIGKNAALGPIGALIL